MSSTRRATDDAILHQCSYSSSQEFPRGLIANLVAKRTAMLDDKADRELVWCVQHLSHQPGGLANVAAKLIKDFSHRLGTPAMVAIGKTQAQKYDADEVKKIRRELPPSLSEKFPLRGETRKEIAQEDRYLQIEAQRARLALDDGEGNCREMNDYREAIVRARESAERKALDAKCAQEYPASYPVQTFVEICRQAPLGADDQPSISPLERELSELCIDPEYGLITGPWYFSDLIRAMREYQRHWIREKSGVVITAIGRKVCETLEYTMEAGILSLLLGKASLGQSFAARAWCEQHPGQARYVEVPPSNDEASFYRAIARALGLGNFLNYKNVQIRERVEYVLQTGGIFLVLNHAERLWPQKNLREAFPGRLAWLLDQVGKGASACMISGPQFFMQGRACEKTGWDSPEFRKKIDHCDCLPDTLDVSDLAAVVRVMLPEAVERIQDSVAIYAVASGRYLAAVEAVTKRAQFIAQKNGRAQRTSQDVRAALTFVNGSDKMLRDSSDAAQKSSRKPHHVEQAAPVLEQIDPPVPVRESLGRMATEPNNNRLAGIMPGLIKTPTNQKI